MAVHFTNQEFKNRKEKVLKNMSEANIDALLMFKQESMYWLTGYDTFGYVFFQCLVLDKSGNIILLTRAPDLRQAQNTSIIKDIRIWIDKAGANPNDDLKRILNELKLEGKKIIFTKVLEAELIKLFSNAYRYINFSISNQFYMICKNQNLDFFKIRNIILIGIKTG